jgi:hypothetical protein
VICPGVDLGVADVNKVLKHSSEVNGHMAS